MIKFAPVFYQIPSWWPDLLSLGFFGITIVRVFTGLVFLDLGWRAWRQRGRVSGRLFGLGVLLAAVMLILGLWTQAAAAALAAAALGKIIVRDENPSRLALWQLLLGNSFALLFLGAGFWAIDLPL